MAKYTKSGPVLDTGSDELTIIVSRSDAVNTGTNHPNCLLAQVTLTASDASEVLIENVTRSGQTITGRIINPEVATAATELVTLGVINAAPTIADIRKVMQVLVHAAAKKRGYTRVP